MSNPFFSTNHFPQHPRHQCEDFDAMFAAGQYGTLLDALTPQMRSVIRRSSGLTPDQREDALSETTLHLLTEFEAGKTYAEWPIQAVACQRARYIVKDMFKHAGKAKAHGFTVVPLNHMFPQTDGGGDTSYEVAANDPDVVDRYLDEELVETAFRGLTHYERQIAVKRCIEDKSAEQAGEELGCTANSVDQTYHRAKKKMRDNLDEYSGGDGQ